MALVDHVYIDAGLTQQFDTSSPLTASAINSGSGDGVFWIGDPDDTIKIQADSDPGIDQIVVSIADADGGTGVAASAIKLALTSAGLGSATGGASLNVGATILGGAANAVPVYFRWSNAVGSGTYTDISLEITARREVAV